MNGSTVIAWRKYDAAVDRLKSVYSQLETEEGRKAVLEKLSVIIARDPDGRTPTGVAAVAKAIGAAMNADAPKYLAGVVHAAQDNVKAAAEELRRAIDADLKSKFMRD
ncbi:hypothetical protein [Bradyrhizobium sp. SZCCHNR3003]|uniref:hypothetical protein n=1 Tax=Bradyrhizobium sp. SZCCHNR3003 TaxID=3057387 RepID=UPI002916BF90|nr:hypothetical protein [Bradyrhizobium sp. SZCCHNR3003]